MHVCSVCVFTCMSLLVMWMVMREIESHSFIQDVAIAIAIAMCMRDLRHAWVLRQQSVRDCASRKAGSALSRTDE